MIDALLKFATFSLGEHELGFPVDAIRQVIDYPSTRVGNPAAGSPVTGMFGWRGKTLPLVDACSALGIKARSNGHAVDAKVVVLSDGRSTAGIVVEAAHDVVTVADHQVSRWDTTTDPGFAMIEAVATLDAGRRVIEIVNTAAFLQLAGLSGSGGSDRSTVGPPSTPASGAQHITFEAAGEAYAMAVSLVVEVVTLAKVIDTLLVSTKCLGMMAYRNGRLPIVPFAALIGGKPAAPPCEETASRVIVMAWGGETVGVLVDAAHGIERFAATDIEALPTEVSDDRQWLQGMARGSDGVGRLVVQPEFLRDNGELAAIAKGYGKIYGCRSRTHERRASHQRKYYLLFKLREVLAVEMNELREIIELPAQCLCPPGMPAYIAGIHSLRGEAVTLLDGRRVYGLPERPMEADSGRSKVLIFHHANLKLGVVVDSVDRIVAADVQSVIPIPRCLMGRLSPDFESDVKDFIEVSDVASRRDLKFIVLEFSRVFGRLRVA